MNLQRLPLGNRRGTAQGRTSLLPPPRIRTSANIGATAIHWQSEVIKRSIYSPRHIVPVAIRLSFHRANDALICRMHHKGLPMDNEVISQAEGDEKILSFNIPDEALERAANAERQAFTWVYCTNGYYWYDCNWPQ